MKPLVLGILGLFVIVWMVQAPDSLADFTKVSATWTWDTTTVVFESVREFLDSLFA